MTNDMKESMREEVPRRGKECRERNNAGDDEGANVEGHKFTGKNLRSQKHSLADDKRNLAD